MEAVAHRVVLSMGLFGVLSGLCGCTAVHRLNSDDLRSVAADEGVVVGSLLVVVAEPDPDQSFWTHGHKAPGKYRVVVKESAAWSDFTVEDFYRLDVRTGTEEFFVAKLPAAPNLGKLYHVSTIETRGWIGNSAPANLPGNFHVRPGAVVYVGRIVIRLPARIGHANPFTVEIEDGETEARERLRVEHPHLLVGFRSDLMRIDAGASSHFPTMSPPAVPVVP
jgi:hypothetical protein